jgi:hypothetical protein
MSRERPRNIAASVADRLLQRARQTGEEHQLLRRFLLPVLEAARQNTAFSSHWPPGGPWHSR